jgi:hypothetical protein
MVSLLDRIFGKREEGDSHPFGKPGNIKVMKRNWIFNVVYTFYLKNRH